MPGNDKTEERIVSASLDRAVQERHEQNKKNIAADAAKRRESLWKEMKFLNEIIKIHPDDMGTLRQRLKDAGIKEGKDLVKPYPYLAVDVGWGLRIYEDERCKRGEVLLGTKEKIEEELCAR